LTADGIDILLISTRSGSHWTIPKGNIKKRLSAALSALEEADEEAGINGLVVKPNLGHFEYRKFGRQYRVKVFLCEVVEMKETWLEDRDRIRRWMSIEEAHRIVKFTDLRPLILKAEDRISDIKTLG
jgi:8-oxo-dGTP pyrophosphatase MutT (NUDIX family)